MNRGHRNAIVVALFAALAVPLVTAAVAAASPRWYPLYDLAMTELRVRDVGLAHPPLVGLPGRLEGHGLQGSHPGPLSFYLLAPTYRLLGSTAWAMEAGVVVLNLVAVGLAVVAARRRGGVAAALGVALALAVAMRALGPEVVSHAWNPFLPVLWWPVFLLAVWSVLDGDRAFLPAVAFAGSFCAQTHVSYGLLVAVLGALAFGWTAWSAWAAWRSSEGAGGRDRAAAWWLLGSLGLVAVLWAPPVVEQLGDGTGNLSILVESFRHPASPAIGLREGFELWCARLDPWGLLAGREGDVTTGTGPTVRALALLAAWAGSVVVVGRRYRRDREDHDDRDDRGGRDLTLLRLDLVLAVALVVGLVSLTRISGVPWFYLHLWSWGTTALVLVATGWALATAAPTHLAARASVAGLAGAAALVVVAGAFTWDTAHREEPLANLTRGVRAVAPDALAALDEVDPDREGVYLVEWIDPVGIGDQGWSLLSELEREGFDANVAPPFAAGARDHRVIDPAEATAVVMLVAGPRIDDVRDRPGVVELAHHDPRTPAERARFADLQEQAAAGLEAAGADPGLLGYSLLVAGQQPGLSAPTRAALVELQELGLPLAVFLEPR
ncbi:MAG TPA: hypothetical protein VIL36_16315 [Acidimicrobiales bacterium]